MKNIAIMQPYFFPYLGYFQLINNVENFLFYGHVDYTRRSYITRNSIVNNMQKVESIGIRTKKEPIGTKIRDIKIFTNDYDRILIDKIKKAYFRLEYFNEIFPLLKPIISYKTKSLMDYNSTTLSEVCKILEIQTKLIPYEKLESDFMKIEEDLKSNHYSSIKPTQRVIYLCEYFNTSTYINPEGGIKIYDTSDFKKKGITIKFHKSDINPHRTGEIIENQYSSIIDVLMINGIERTKKMVGMGSFFSP